MRFSRISTVALAAVAAVSLLGACGQKGALYLRDNPPAGIKVPKPATPKPVPYPVDPSTEREKD
jgi:predicted small lipoprotein YifL